LVVTPTESPAPALPAPTLVGHGHSGADHQRGEISAIGKGDGGQQPAIAIPAEIGQQHRAAAWQQAFGRLGGLLSPFRFRRALRPIAFPGRIVMPRPDRFTLGHAGMADLKGIAVKNPQNAARS
jgi:hypothetical protein